MHADHAAPFADKRLQGRQLRRNQERAGHVRKDSDAVAAQRLGREEARIFGVVHGKGCVGGGGRGGEANERGDCGGDRSVSIPGCLAETRTRKGDPIIAPPC